MSNIIDGKVLSDLLINRIKDEMKDEIKNAEQKIF